MLCGWDTVGSVLLLPWRALMELVRVFAPIGHLTLNQPRTRVRGLQTSIIIYMWV